MSRLCLSVVFAAFLAVVSDAGAQTARPCPPLDGGVLFACQVDTPPVATPDSPTPPYPDALFHEGVPGVVRVQYVIDTTGRMARGSFRLVYASQERFARAVRAVAPRWRQTPAMNLGRRVPVRFEEEYVFNADPDEPPIPPVVRRDTTADGVPRTAIGRPPRDPSASSAFTAEDLLEAQRAALAQVAADRVPRVKPAQDSLRTLCLLLLSEGGARPADGETLRRLSSGLRRAVPMDRCPRTYTQMMVGPDWEPPPPGWIDPYRLRVTRVMPWRRDVVSVEVELYQSTSGEQLRCGAVRTPNGWRAVCRSLRIWSH